MEDNQLSIRGKQQDDKGERISLSRHRRTSFSRTFVLAEGIEVKSADLRDGLLAIDLMRHEPERLVRRIEIGSE